MPNYPYTSGQGALVAAFMQLRKNFPAKVDSAYLKRFNIAPSNESYVISILRFLDLIDDEGTKVESNTGFFFGSEEAFQQGLEGAIRAAYGPLFDEMGDDAFTAERATVAHWFRQSDRSSELVGNRQASTFQTLAALAGHGELPTRATPAKKAATNGTTPVEKVAAKKAATPRKAAEGRVEDNDGSDGGGDEGVVITKNGQGVGLTVRIEVNLPPGGDADTYDAIFASIKKHLMS